MTEPTEPTCGNCRWCAAERDVRGFRRRCENTRAELSQYHVEPTDTCDHHEPAETKQ